MQINYTCSQRRGLLPGTGVGRSTCGTLMIWWVPLMLPHGGPGHPAVENAVNRGPHSVSISRLASSAESSFPGGPLRAE